MRKTTVHILSIVTSALLTMAGASLTVISCTKTTVPDTDASPEGAITFSGVDTKAAVEDASEIKEFYVWLYRDGRPLLNKERVYLQNGYWVYDNLQQWQSGTNAFGAFYPTSLDDGQIEVTMQSGDRGIVIEKFDGSDADDDLLVAYYSRNFDQSNPDTSPVPLEFSHLLSRVSLAGVSAGPDITITDIIFSGMAVYGTYNEDGQEKWKPIIDDDAPAGSFEVKDIDLSSDGAEIVLLADLLLIPQQVEETAITVKYKMDGEDQPEENFVLPSSPEWNEGKSYKYVLGFGSADVKLSIKVEDWIDGGDKIIEW